MTSPAPESDISIATWVAAVGAALVLVAAAVFTVGSWNDLAAATKVAALVTTNGLLAAAAARLGRAAPAVARVLAQLATAMTVPSAVAVAAAFHRTWPAAIACGGGVGVLACSLGAHRWTAGALRLGAEASTVLALAGMATLAGVPLGVLLATSALALVAAGREWSGVRLAVVAASAPVMAVLGTFDIGPGTAARLGARADVLTWAGPAAGLAAALALGIVAHRRALATLAAASTAAALTGVSVGLTALAPPRPVWLGAVGGLVLAVALADQLAERATSVWRRVTEPLLAAAFGATILVTVALGSAAMTVTAGVSTSATLAWAGSIWAVGALALYTRASTSVDALGGARVCSVALAMSATGIGTGQALAAAIVGWLAYAVLLVVRSARLERTEMVIVAAAPAAFVRFTSPAWVASAALIAAVILLALEASNGATICLIPRPIPIALSVTAWITVALGWPEGVWAPAVATAAVIIVLAASGCVAAAAALIPIQVIQLVRGSGAGSLTVADAGVGAAAVTWTTLAAVARRRNRRWSSGSSWPAYGPPIAFSGLYLLATNADTGQAWRVALALGIGVASVAVGGVWRLGAPLLVGTALLAATVIVGWGAQLAALPVWSWIAFGGLGLLVLAALIDGRGPTRAGGFVGIRRLR